MMYVNEYMYHDNYITFDSNNRFLYCCILHPLQIIDNELYVRFYNKFIMCNNEMKQVVTNDEHGEGIEVYDKNYSYVNKCVFTVNRLNLNEFISIDDKNMYSLIDNSRMNDLKFDKCYVYYPLMYDNLCGEYKLCLKYMNYNIKYFRIGDDVGDVKLKEFYFMLKFRDREYYIKKYISNIDSVMTIIEFYNAYYDIMKSNDLNVFLNEIYDKDVLSLLSKNNLYTPIMYVRKVLYEYNARLHDEAMLEKYKSRYNL